MGAKTWCCPLGLSPTRTPALAAVYRCSGKLSVMLSTMPVMPDVRKLRALSNWPETCWVFVGFWVRVVYPCCTTGV